MKKYVEVDARRLAELVLCARYNECIDFAEEWNEEDVIDGRDDVDAVAWHGIKRIELFDESSYGYGVIAIGMWGGGWTKAYDTTGDDDYLNTLEHVTNFIQEYFNAVENKTVLAELEVYEDNTTLLDKIRME